MEKREVSVKEKENPQPPVIVREGNRFRIGREPELFIDLDTQGNYLLLKDVKIPYREEVHLSPDLLIGKRGEVLLSVLEWHYQKAQALPRLMAYAKAFADLKNQ